MWTEDRESRLGRKAADVARTLIEEVDVEKTENEENPRKRNDMTNY